MFPTVLYQFGGSLFDPETNTATINNEAGVQALQTIMDWIYTYHIAAPESNVAGWDAFVDGRIGMIANGTWFRNFLVENNPDVNWQVWPAIQWGPEVATTMDAHVLFMPSTLEGERLEATQRFVTWISDHGVDWAASGMVPARQSQVAELDEENYPSNIIIGNSIVEAGQAPPQSEYFLEIQDAWEPEVNAALNGQKTAEEALNTAAQLIQETLDRAG
jgi:multiple sugar transport system substrate-binding protein